MVRPFRIAENQGFIAKTMILNLVPNYQVDAVMLANVLRMVWSYIRIRRYEKDIGGPSVVELFDNFPPSFLRVLFADAIMATFLFLLNTSSLGITKSTRY